MSDSFSAVKLTDRVYWVGAIDWELRDFHGYAVERGSTYNAYLVLADKVTLIDTVKAPFYEQMMARVASVVDPGKISYVVANHAEMDHTGSLPRVIERVKPEKVVASAPGVKAIGQHFRLSQELTAVKNGETLSLGNTSLTFLGTPMVHWPDSMFSYLADERLLFSNDAFGMHLASTERFADELPEWLLDYEGSRYYANIVLPFSTLVLKLLDKVKQLGLAIDIIAPSHGPVWRKNPSWIVNRYADWAGGPLEKKALIVYDSMWHSTELMAAAIADGVQAGGARAKLLSLKGSHRSDVAHEALKAGVLLVGSPTLNNGMLPSVADALTYLKGLKPRVPTGAAFGSYGWSGEACAHIEDVLSEMGLSLLREALRVKYVPNEEALAQCVELGRLTAARLLSPTAGAGA